MRLADFILANVEPILAEWEAYARSIWPSSAAATVEPEELRDDAEHLLRSTVVDMQSDQTAAQQSDKSKGQGSGGQHSDVVDRASHVHAVGRVGSGFDLASVVAEYRALRASVIRLWRKSEPAPDLH